MPKESKGQSPDDVIDSVIEASDHVESTKAAFESAGKESDPTPNEAAQEIQRRFQDAGVEFLECVVPGRGLVNVPVSRLANQLLNGAVILGDQ